MKVNVDEVQKLMLKLNHDLREFMEDVTITIDGYELNSKDKPEREREITRLTLAKSVTSIEDIDV